MNIQKEKGEKMYHTLEPGHSLGNGVKRERRLERGHSHILGDLNLL